MIKAYWLIGRDIVEQEQEGRERANYGSFLIQGLAKRLNSRFGRGFGTTTLKQARTFYLEYQSDKSTEKGQTVCDLSVPKFNPFLSWSHYRSLLKVKYPNARKFYERETEENCWSVRELDRQIDSLLFERLAKSKDKDGLLKLASSGQEINKPEDAIKDPLILEFLGLPESEKLIESDLEAALINNLQKFLLELGKGFAFIARQKRLSLDNDQCYADLVFYHVILKCYVIIDIKTQALSHGDLGQIQLYVNYFDKEIKEKNDNPTISLVLCTQNKKQMAEYLLGEKSKQIFTSAYKLHLPTETELEAELKREIEAIKYNLSTKNKS